ncbi:D-ribose pyranase [Dactylosporangium siamense]|uniref:D-ribose pyranase n=1 Tax=Dactylosporangium siamense TaxID=685454 RepID=A0A919PGC2_9ACTN|nr:D-ribose pyranase [Dactylosporangium siamense]GIG43672.1 D-ribose pyranase [Dactylosporangium siamense]
MRDSGLWHPRLAALVAGMGHTDIIVVADAGLPVPPGVEVVQLAVTRGVPAFLPVLAAIAAELVVEEATVADELTDEGIRAGLSGFPVRTVPHEDFKVATRKATAIVRTGEATPYANVILRAGVPF